MKRPHPAIDVSHLSVNYDKTPALWDVSFSLPQGELVGIIGPNGAGKSTLLKALMGLLSPLSGRSLFFGQPLDSVRQRVAYVPQRESIDWDFPITARDLVLMGRYGQLGLFHWPRAADRAAATRALELVDMLPFADRQIRQLSGGQQQRIFIARALMQQADIILLDEPFSGIDMATEATIVEILKELCAKGKTVVVVHHDLNSVESYFTTLLLLNIRLVACGPVKETFLPQHLYAAYGKSYALLDEAFRLSKEKTTGQI